MWLIGCSSVGVSNYIITGTTYLNGTGTRCYGNANTNNDDTYLCTISTSYGYSYGATVILGYLVAPTLMVEVFLKHTLVHKNYIVK